MCWNSNLLYLDTCIIIELSKSDELLKRFIKFVNQNNYKLVVSDFLCLELVRKSNLNQKYYEIISQIPHILALPVDKVTEAEVLSYPDKLKRSIEFFETIDPEEVIQELIIKKKIISANFQYENDKKRLVSIINTFIQNGYNDPQQTSLLWVANTFLSLYPQRWNTRVGNQDSLDVEKIPSIWLQAQVAFERYISRKAIPEENDLGDFLHVSFFPYCSFVITEEKMCQSLNIIKKETKSEILQDIEFRDMKFVRKL